MFAAYDRAAKLNGIWRILSVDKGRRRSTDMDDGGARFEKTKSLSWLVSCLWDNEHYSYERECEATTGDGGISL